MKLYAGIDLPANNSVVVVIDEEDRILYQKPLFFICLSPFFDLSIDRKNGREHFVCMKRTNLVLDEQLLKEAVHLSGERTYSGVVNRALDDFVRRIKARRILELAHSGLWQGDLSTMRDDKQNADDSR